MKICGKKFVGELKDNKLSKSDIPRLRQTIFDTRSWNVIKVADMLAEWPEGAERE
jgi:hypothetical protein